MPSTTVTMKLLLAAAAAFAGAPAQAFDMGTTDPAETAAASEESGDIFLAGDFLIEMAHVLEEFDEDLGSYSYSFGDLNEFDDLDHSFSFDFSFGDLKEFEHHFPHSYSFGQDDDWADWIGAEIDPDKEDDAHWELSYAYHSFDFSYGSYYFHDVDDFNFPHSYSFGDFMHDMDIDYSYPLSYVPDWFVDFDHSYSYDLGSFAFDDKFGDYYDDHLEEEDDGEPVEYEEEEEEEEVEEPVSEPEEDDDSEPEVSYITVTTASSFALDGISAADLAADACVAVVAESLLATVFADFTTSVTLDITAVCDDLGCIDVDYQLVSSEVARRLQEAGSGTTVEFTASTIIQGSEDGSAEEQQSAAESSFESQIRESAEASIADASLSDEINVRAAASEDSSAALVSLQEAEVDSENSFSDFETSSDVELSETNNSGADGESIPIAAIAASVCVASVVGIIGLAALAWRRRQRDNSAKEPKNGADRV